MYYKSEHLIHVMYIALVWSKYFSTPTVYAKILNKRQDKVSIKVNKLKIYVII